MKAEIDAGALGDIYHARSWMLRRTAIPTRPGFLLKKHSGGGATIDIGVHILDLTLWFMGNPKACFGDRRCEESTWQPIRSPLVLWDNLAIRYRRKWM